MTSRWSRVALLALAGLILLGSACDSQVDVNARPGLSALIEKRFRSATTPPRPVLAVDATKEARARVLASARDLKVIDAWRPLTRTLDGIAVGVGQRRIPKDGHLADARLEVRTGFAESRTCSITLFPRAIHADLVRQAEYKTRGLIARVPHRADFWAALLAHELAHCLPGPRGEQVALRWERQVLIALETKSR